MTLKPVCRGSQQPNLGQLGKKGIFIKIHRVKKISLIHSSNTLLYKKRSKRLSKVSQLESAPKSVVLITILFLFNGLRGSSRNRHPIQTNTENMWLIYNEQTNEHPPVLNWMFASLQSEDKKYCRQRLLVWDFLTSQKTVTRKRKRNSVSIFGKTRRDLKTQTTEGVAERPRQ